MHCCNCVQLHVLYLFILGFTHRGLYSPTIPTLLYSSLFPICGHEGKQLLTLFLDHDDGIITHIELASSGWEQSKSNDWYLIYRHRVDNCINFMSLYLFIWFIFLLLLEHTSVTFIRISEKLVLQTVIENKTAILFRNTALLLCLNSYGAIRYF